jgi:hypothetical protein
MGGGIGSVPSTFLGVGTATALLLVVHYVLKASGASGGPPAAPVTRPSA